MKLPMWLLSVALMFVFALPVLGMDIGPPDSGVVIEQMSTDLEVSISNEGAFGEVFPFSGRTGAFTSFIKDTNLIELLDQAQALTSGLEIISDNVAKITLFGNSTAARKFSQPYVEFAVVVSVHRHLEGGGALLGVTEPLLRA